MGLQEKFESKETPGDKAVKNCQKRSGKELSDKKKAEIKKKFDANMKKEEFHNRGGVMSKAKRLLNVVSKFLEQNDVTPGAGEAVALMSKGLADRRTAQPTRDALLAYGQAIGLNFGQGAKAGNIEDSYDFQTEIMKGPEVEVGKLLKALKNITVKKTPVVGDPS